MQNEKKKMENTLAIENAWIAMWLKISVCGVFKMIWYILHCTRNSTRLLIDGGTPFDATFMWRKMKCKKKVKKKTNKLNILSLWQINSDHKRINYREKCEKQILTQR